MTKFTAKDFAEFFLKCDPSHQLTIIKLVDDPKFKPQNFDYLARTTKTEDPKIKAIRGVLTSGDTTRSMIDQILEIVN